MLLITHEGKSVQRLTATQINYLSKKNNESQKIIRSIREKEYWIQCDCKRSNQAIMIPRVRNTQNGAKYHLANKVNSSPHHPDCDFYTEQSDSVAGGARKKRTSYCFHVDPKINEDESVAVKKSNSTRSKQTKDTLIGMIYDLYDLSGENHFDTTRKNIFEVLKNLKESAKISFGPQFQLKDVIWLGGNNYHRNGLLLDISKKWDQPGRPHIVQLFFVESIQKTALGSVLKFKNGKSYELPNVEVKVAGRVNLDNGPFLVAMTLVCEWQNKKPIFRHGRASAVSVCPETLVVVDSDFERQVLSMLRRTIYGFNKNYNTQLKAYKPVEDIIHKGERFRPDFIVYNQSTYKEVILEVMGSHESEYIESKRTTMPRMRSYLDVIEFDAYQASLDNTFENKAREACRNVCRSCLAVRDSP